MSDTTSIDAAAVAVNALLAQIETSNARLIQCQDTGTADNYVFAPTPAVASYGPDLLILADIANPNLTTTPVLNLSGLGKISITASNGTPVAIGAVVGKCLFGLSSAAGGGYVARAFSFAPSNGSSASTPFPNVDSLTVGTTLNANDKITLWSEEAENGLSSGVAFAATLASLAKFILAGGDSSLWHIGALVAGSTANALNVAFTPAPASNATNYFCAVACTSTNTGPATLNGQPVIIDKTGAALTGGEIPTIARAQFFFDGTSYRLMNPAAASINVYAAPNVGCGSGQQNAIPFTGTVNSFGAWNNGTFTFTVAGNYTIKGWVSAYLSFPANEGFSSTLLLIYNGTTIDGREDVGYGANGANANLGVNATIPNVAVGDTIVIAFIPAGAPYAVGCSTNNSRLTIKKDS